MEAKEAKEKATALETLKIVAPWLSLPIGTLILALVPVVRNRIWPATPKELLLGLLVISLSANLALIPSALRFRKRRLELKDLRASQEQKQIQRLEEQVKELTQVNLDETDAKLLLTLANIDLRRPTAAILSPLVGIHTQEAQYRLDRLLSIHYLKRHPASGATTAYLLDHKGREYLVKNKQI